MKLPIIIVRDSALTRTLLGALLISFSGIFIRLADIGATQSAFYRNVYAVPALLGLLLVARRGNSVTKHPLILPLFILVGAIEGGEVIAYHVAVGIIGAGLATLLASLQVLFVGMASAWFLAEQPRREFWLALPFILVGIWLLSATGQVVGTGASFLFGLAIGVFGALMYASYLMLLRIVRGRYPKATSIEIMVSATLGIVIVTGLTALYEGVAAPPKAVEANVWILCLALGTPVFGWLLITSSIHLLPSAMTSTILLLQPTLAVLWGVTLLGEPIDLMQAIGVVFVLIGIAIAHQATTAQHEKSRI